MARFTREILDNTVRPSVAWSKITNSLKAGFNSVEVVSRVIDGEDKWEIRSWDSLRADRSNSARASPNKDH